jgi:hypothetical protein
MLDAARSFTRNASPAILWSEACTASGRACTACSTAGRASFPTIGTLPRSSAAASSGRRIRSFIADSQQFLPANRMPYAGMPNAADRADLIAYLQQVAK